eukprot:TRINITY_DN15809_c0_g1_i1.p1 TRINITY_DN15809_c0_g1~~TRINITY_DN15809_c0_g1_i1.p1  ORF type:complete len:144 (+),score=7.01 TRINITY_DN15809_c0_g1_i1:159-590(+)
MIRNILTKYSHLNKIYSKYYCKNINLNPKKITLKREEKRLEIEFQNNKTFSYPTEYLRVFSPSIEQVDRLVSNRRYINIVEMKLVGKYALQITFDDLHENGIYSFEYLYELGIKKYSNLKWYLKELKKNNKKRDPLMMKKVKE